ncbi:MAG: PAC2 family protein [Actinomycetota bacterium]
MPAHRVTDPSRPLVAPVLVAAFDGWVDAAAAATAAVEVIAADGDVVVSFDPDDLYDYRSRRPTLDIIDGTMRRLDWPDLAIRHASHGGRDLLVLTGPEPDFRWRELGADLAAIARRFDVVEWVSLGAVPSAVPHTRPVPILTTASAPGLLRDGEIAGPPGLLRVPSAALSAIESIANDHAVPSVGFYAQIPHYVGGPFAPATLALLEAAGRHLGVTFGADELREEAAGQRERLDRAVAADDDSRAYVARLEAGLGSEEQQIPSGDELAQEIERFLRGESGDEPGRGGR